MIESYYYKKGQMMEGLFKKMIIESFWQPSWSMQKVTLETLNERITIIQYQMTTWFFMQCKGVRVSKLCWISKNSLRISNFNFRGLDFQRKLIKNVLHHDFMGTLLFVSHLQESKTHVWGSWQCYDFIRFFSGEQVLIYSLQFFN